MVFADHSAMSTNLAIIEYTVNVENKATFKKYQTLAKSIQGDTGPSGSVGPSGVNGLRTAQGMVHYALSSSSAPTGPDDGTTSFNFSTGVMSGMRANWQMGAPTYASGNTNKYWYATFTSVEDSAGAGVATNSNNSFGSVTQAIGFSGLVSFTSNEAVGDGTNALSFGVSGTTLINGDNISTGRIISTNYATGSGDGFTTTGTEFNLDEGLIASKNFKIAPNGDANFRGTITSTAGSIGGWTLGSTTLTGGSTTLTNTGDITVGTSNDVARLSSSDGTYRLWIGNATAASAPFRVTKAGVLTASGATISGDITATTGTFTGTVNATGGNFTGYVTAGGMRFGADVSGTNDGIYIDANDYWYSDGSFSLGNGNLTWDGTGLVISGSGTFSGDLQAAGGTFNGSVNITSDAFSVTAGDGANRVALFDNNSEDASYISITNTGGGMTIGESNGTAGMYPAGASDIDTYVFSGDVTAFQIGNNVSTVQISNGGSSGISIAPNAATCLYYNDSSKLCTTNTGIAVTGAITATGNITAFFSDDRLKTRLNNISDALLKIKSLNGFEFELNETSRKLGIEDDGIQIGVSAQEVQKVLPQIVKPAPINENYLTVQYERLVPLLIEGIKELSDKIEYLENEILKLKEGK
jgi:hypothetical protein